MNEQSERRSVGPENGLFEYNVRPSNRSWQVCVKEHADGARSELYGRYQASIFAQYKTVFEAIEIDPSFWNYLEEMEKALPADRKRIHVVTDDNGEVVGGIRFFDGSIYRREDAAPAKLPSEHHMPLERMLIDKKVAPEVLEEFVPQRAFDPRNYRVSEMGRLFVRRVERSVPPLVIRDTLKLAVYDFVKTLTQHVKPEQVALYAHPVDNAQLRLYRRHYHMTESGTYDDGGEYKNTFMRIDGSKVVDLFNAVQSSWTLSPRE